MLLDVQDFRDSWHIKFLQDSRELHFDFFVKIVSLSLSFMFLWRNVNRMYFSTMAVRIMYCPLPVLSRLLKRDSRKENLWLPTSRQLVQLRFCPNCRRKILPRFLEPGLDRKLRLLRCQQNHVTHHFRHLLLICEWWIAPEEFFTSSTKRFKKTLTASFVIF